MKIEKFLILRFSSFGDVTQCLSVPAKIKEKWPNAQIHWAVRDDLAALLSEHPAVDQIWPFPRKSNLIGLLRFAFLLRRQRFSRVYDAHNSTRSWVISTLIGITTRAQILRKSQKRWMRFLLFRLRIDLYQKPRSGQRDLLEPLKAWGLDETLPTPPQLHFTNQESQDLQKRLPVTKFVALAPSAAYELKRWPLEFWKKLIHLHPQENFILLGGPEDTFLETIRTEYPDRVWNWAGRTSLRETALVVKFSKALVANDTGILHTAEQLGHPAIALMGPAPFGFPSRKTTQVLELELPCRPCSKHGQGPCTNVTFHRCLRDISPERVSTTLLKLVAT